MQVEVFAVDRKIDDVEVSFEIELPPLRARGDDIALLASTFLREIAERQGLPVPELGDEQIEELRLINKVCRQKIAKKKAR